MELRCENISKTFGSVVALRDVSLTVRAGEIRALLGGNGSGKSTLAKILGGVYFANSGKITFDGKDYTKSTPGKAKKNGMVVTSQELSLFANLTVSENLNIANLPAKGIFVDKQLMRNKAVDILKKIKMEKLIDQKVSTLAPNQLYLLEFAKALLQKPRVLVIDEITSALFRDDVAIVKELLHELKAQGVVILFISHRMGEIYSICDSVTVMRNGESIGTFPIEEKDENELLSLMVGKIIGELHVASAEDGETIRDESIALSLDKHELKNFGTQIDLQIKKGEIIGIAGLQGHGQSDLVRSIFGLQNETDVKLYGKTLRIDSPVRSVKEGFAFISGDRIRDGVFAQRSVMENLDTVNSIVLNRKGEYRQEQLDKLGVKYNDMQQQITELSGGNQQKVVVGRWLSAKPIIVLADDPTKGIDVQARRDIHQILCEIAAAGASVLLFSSDDEELVELTRMTNNSRIVVMYEGTIAAELCGENITVHNIIDYSLAKRGVVQ